MFFFWTTPLVSACKSIKMNNVILHFEYIPVAAFGILFYFSFLMVALPITYIMTLWMKLKFIFESPAYSKTDR